MRDMQGGPRKALRLARRPRHQRTKRRLRRAPRPPRRESPRRAGGPERRGGGLHRARRGGVRDPRADGDPPKRENPRPRRRAARRDGRAGACAENERPRRSRAKQPQALHPARARHPDARAARAEIAPALAGSRDRMHGKPPRGSPSPRARQAPGTHRAQIDVPRESRMESRAARRRRDHGRRLPVRAVRAGALAFSPAGRSGFSPS